jgi:hypothetical protein
MLQQGHSRHAILQISFVPGSKDQYDSGTAPLLEYHKSKDTNQTPGLSERNLRTAKPFRYTITVSRRIGLEGGCDNVVASYGPEFSLLRYIT